MIGILSSSLTSGELERNEVFSEKFGVLRETFFNGQRINVIKRFLVTSRLMKSLVNCVWSFMVIYLGLEKEFTANNLLEVAKLTPLRAEPAAQPAPVEEAPTVSSIRTKSQSRLE